MSIYGMYKGSHEERRKGVPVRYRLVSHSHLQAVGLSGDCLQSSGRRDRAAKVTNPYK